jgi:hypothetical protein
MMETVIAIGVGLVVGGGLLTLVYRILAGDPERRKIDAALADLVGEAPPKPDRPRGGKR